MFDNGKKFACWLVCRAGGVVAIVTIAFVLWGCSRSEPVAVSTGGQVQVPVVVDDE